MADRIEVFAAIESELDYQQEIFGDNPHEIDAFATYVRHYSRLLDEACTRSIGDHDKLVVFRKVAAVCARCLEQHGAPKRKAAQAQGD
jgi:hypothetical protein